MERFLFYGPLVIILVIVSWFYYRGEQVPEVLIPVIVLLFALMSFGYGRKSQKDGDIGKIHQDKNPRLFQTALHFNHVITGALLILAIYLFVV